MAYETDAEREARQQAELAAEVVEHRKHLNSPFLVKPREFSDSLGSTHIAPPEIPASPTTQDIANVLVALGLVTQSE